MFRGKVLVVSAFLVLLQLAVCHMHEAQAQIFMHEALTQNTVDLDPIDGNFN